MPRPRLPRRRTPRRRTTGPRPLRPALASVAALLVVVLAALITAADTPAGPIAPTALAATPPMGVNNWNATGCGPEFGEAWVRAQADALVATGLRDAGYRYVDLDDCWAVPQRDAAGRLVPDPVRFPHGIAAIAEYVHARGLRLGIYSSAGTTTCDARGFPGALGHETADAATFAAWGVDYLKYDDCSTAGTDAVARYTVMARALRDTGRPIVYAVCDKGNSAPWIWGAGVAQLWRTTPDVTDSWASIADIIRRELPLTRYQRLGGWNDPDMLEVGNGGLSPDEERTQVAVWSVLAAPLIAGTDLSRASPATLALLGNRALIAVDQDPLAAPATVERADPDGRLVLRRAMSDGSTVTAVVALGDVPVVVPAVTGGTDLLSGRTVAGGAVVPPHGTVLWRS
jgi:alpha-galactosidase